MTSLREQLERIGALQRVDAKAVPLGMSPFIFISQNRFFLGSNLRKIGQARICFLFFFTEPPKTHSLKTSLWHY